MQNKVTLTLTLDYSVAQEVLSLITRQQSNAEVPTSPFKLPEDKVSSSLGKVATEPPITYGMPLNGTRTFPILDTPTDSQMTSQMTTVLQANNMPVVVKPTAGKKTAMPSFGRSQAQIDSFAEAEASRVEAKTEAEEEREQRAADRAAKKAVKEEEEAEKQFHANKLAAEVEAIKAAELHTTPAVMPKKPWAL